MARRNRVTPEGKIIATPARGLFMGNRGCLHDAEGRLGPARWRHRAWICCVLSFRGRRRQVMTPGRYTELFFLDEAVALAAGHRPCAQCRRADFLSYRTAFGGSLKAPEIDAALHAARTGPAGLSSAPAEGLPDGTFIRDPGDGTPRLLWQGRALAYTPAGYRAALPRPPGQVTVLTPVPSVAALAAGYAPLVHPSACHTAI